MKRDAGLQPERTSLAWRRTALSALVNGALLVRAAAEARSPMLWTISLLVVLAAAVIFGVGLSRDRTLMIASNPQSPHAALAVLLVGTVWLACGAGVVTMLK